MYILVCLSMYILLRVSMMGGGRGGRKAYSRKQWQRRAEEEEPPEPCQDCTHYVKREIIEKPAPRKITHLTFVARNPVSGETSKKRQVKGKVVDDLNKAVRAHGRGQGAEELQRLLAPVAKRLLQQIRDWLPREPAPRDVSIDGHLAGGEVTFQFIRYHCRQSTWEKKDEWKATMADERDEHVTTLGCLNPTEPGMVQRVTPVLTQRLIQFIKKV